MEQELIMGSVALLIGVFTLVMRVTAPAKLGKLGPMQEKFGNGLGSAIHFTAYTLVPLGFGGLMVFRSLMS